MLSILLADTETYGTRDEAIKDEMFTIFFAGMKTVQASTSNFIYFMTKHPEYKQKFLAEVIPVVEKAKGDFVKDLEYDDVMEFDYLRQCYNEVLRIEPPAAMTFAQTVSEDTTFTTDS